MGLNPEMGYIWTALTPDIKAMVEAGGESSLLLGHAPYSEDTLEGCGCPAVYFGTMPGPNSDHRQ